LITIYNKTIKKITFLNGLTIGKFETVNIDYEEFLKIKSQVKNLEKLNIVAIKEDI
jgi:hypothetical protein